jgi:hypothetical protein
MMKFLIHEDNSGALVLPKTLPPQFTPQSKHYAIKTIWFCKEMYLATEVRQCQTVRGYFHQGLDSSYV